MKTSNRLLLLFLGLVVFLIVLTAFVFRPYPAYLKWPVDHQYIMGEGRIVADTQLIDYHYVWTDFQDVSLDPSVAGRVEVRGYENAMSAISVEVRNDTLFISQGIGSDPYSRFSYDIEKRPIQVIAGSSSLLGMEAVGWGAFSVNASRFALDEQETIDKPNTSTDKILRNKNLNITLTSGGQVTLPVDNQVINVTISGARHLFIPPTLDLSGHCNLLRIDHRETYADVKAFSLDADSVQISSETPFSSDAGIFRVSAEKCLNATISGASDILYLGQPRIEKKEHSSGRVVDANRYR
ncbi:MAG: DUF2807 domain-containing protein [Saprospiraceae bacterium]|nr:DUF2807 domain-containing protein [Lewinella sp.]